MPRKLTASSALVLLAASLPVVAAPRVVAVLELRARVSGSAAKGVDSAYFTDRVRQAALAMLPEDNLLSRENLVAFLNATGKKVEDCEGECEVDTGRRVGADLVISGELVSLGASLSMSLRVHDTRSGQLIGAASATAPTPEELDAKVASTVGQLVERIRPAVVLAAPVALAPLEMPAALRSEGVRLDVDADVLVAYDAALSADENGSQDPDAAAAAWRRLAAIQTENPYRADAAARARQWDDFAAAHKAVFKTHEQDVQKLRKVLPLASLRKEQKTMLLRQFRNAYGPAAVNEVIDAIPESERAAYCMEFLDPIAWQNTIRASVYSWNIDVRPPPIGCKEARLQTIGWRVLEGVMTTALQGVCEARGYRRPSKQEADQLIGGMNMPGSSGFVSWASERASHLFLPPDAYLDLKNLHETQKAPARGATYVALCPEGAAKH